MHYRAVQVLVNAQISELCSPAQVLIWKLAEVPKNDKYDYTYFAHMLNSFETAPKPVLASDGRIRADRLALERGNNKKAGSDKTK